MGREKKREKKVGVSHSNKKGKKKEKSENKKMCFLILFAFANQENKYTCLFRNTNSPSQKSSRFFFFWVSFMEALVILFKTYISFHILSIHEL